MESPSNPKIKHVFVLMLENRSFDHLLGFSGISKDNKKINGLSGKEFNTVNESKYPVIRGADDSMPLDPYHIFPHVVEQVGGAGAVYVPSKPYPVEKDSDKTGYASTYADLINTMPNPSDYKIGEIMKCFLPDQIPNLYTLAKTFAVCDSYHCSLPGPTWPNRYFMHGASSSGMDSAPNFDDFLEMLFDEGFTYENGSIYDRMKEHGITYRIYRGACLPIEGSFPIVSSIKGMEFWETHPYEDFHRDVSSLDYPIQYTFIEPNYGRVFSDYKHGTSQHPMDSASSGDFLIGQVYNAIRNSPHWDSSVLFINYDEHGGFFDHVHPPNAIPPGDTINKVYNSDFKFDFSMLGVRVPCIVISPWIQSQIDSIVYDHTSILATVEKIWPELSTLTDRDKNANNMIHLFGNVLRNDCPDHLPTGPSEVKKIIELAEDTLDRIPEVISKIERVIEGTDWVNELIEPTGNEKGFLALIFKAKVDLFKRNTTNLDALNTYKQLQIAEFNAVTTKGKARECALNFLQAKDAMEFIAKEVAEALARIGTE